MMAIMIKILMSILNLMILLILIKEVTKKNIFTDEIINKYRLIYLRFKIKS